MRTKEITGQLNLLKAKASRAALASVTQSPHVWSLPLVQWFSHGCKLAPRWNPCSFHQGKALIFFYIGGGLWNISWMHFHDNIILYAHCSVFTDGPLTFFLLPKFLFKRPRESGLQTIKAH